MYYNTRDQQVTTNCPLNGYLEDGTLVQGLDFADEATQKLCGVYPIKSDSPPQPANTIEDILARSIVIEDDGVIIIRTWVPEPIIIPTSISARQIRLWLIENNISLSSVETAINGIVDDKLREKTLVEWEYAPYVERNHPLLETLASVLGLTNEQIDAGFIQASQL